MSKILFRVKKQPSPPTKFLNKHAIDYAIFKQNPGTIQDKIELMEHYYKRRDEKKELLAQNSELILIDEGSLLGKLYENDG